MRDNSAKLISSAIIVLAAALLIVGGSHVRHTDTQTFVMFVGCAVGLAGLGGWFATVRQTQSK
jgi:hypothetical protein